MKDTCAHCRGFGLKVPFNPGYSVALNSACCSTVVVTNTFSLTSLDPVV